MTLASPQPEADDCDMHPTLAQFLLDRLAEREEVARAATPGPWEWDGAEFSDAPHGSCQHGTRWTDHGPDLVTVAGEEKKGQHRSWWEPAAKIIQADGYDASRVLVRTADAAHIALNDPAYVLADCEAKRRMVDGLVYLLNYEPEGEVAVNAVHFLRLLALPFADHPDYRPEWKP